MQRKTRNAYVVEGAIFMTQSEILEVAKSQSGMTQKEFAEYFGIPYRTVQDWFAGRRNMPDYVLRLMIYKLEMEKKVQGLSKELEQN